MTAGPQAVTAAPLVVFVTGASSGIGRASAVRFAEQGARLVLLSRSPEALAAVEGDCRRAGAAATLVTVADVGVQEQVEVAMACAVATFGRVDICVHAAAVAAYGRLEDIPAEVFDRVIDTNVKGAANVARAAISHFREREQGTLILVGSVLGRIAAPFISPYGVSKWAIRGLARTVKLENQDLPDVHVCEVWPGGVNTPVYQQSANYAGRVGRPPPPVVPPERVAAAIDRVARHPRPRVGVGWANPIMVFGFAFLPGLYDTLVVPLMKLLGIGRERLEPHPGNVLAPQAGAEATRGPWRGLLGLRRSARSKTGRRWAP